MFPMPGVWLGCRSAVALKLYAYLGEESSHVLSGGNPKVFIALPPSQTALATGTHETDKSPS